MSKSTLTMIAAGTAVLLTGCQSLHLLDAGPLHTIRECCDAKLAWSVRRDIYEGCEPHLDDFGQGFEAGYKDIVAGGNGRPPIMPPQQFYSISYESPAGKERLIAWYNGWSQGAYAAQCDGRYGRNLIFDDGEVSGTLGSNH